MHSYIMPTYAMLLHRSTVKSILFYVGSLRTGFSTNHRLNRNAIVSLSDDEITKEKSEINIMRHPHTPFLAPTN